MKYILAFDQGTTSSRAILFDQDANVVKVAQKEIRQIYPKPGWVEHDPMEIWGSQSGVAREVIESAGIRPFDIAAIGITNQRETTVIWDKNTGKPIYNAIVWQCRRTAEICQDLKEKGLEDYVKKNTGLVIDAYFSATKIKWILDHVEGARKKAERGDLLFGNIDTWLIWNMTRGKVHVTDYSNASRTMLFNIQKLEWDQRLLEELGIPFSMLPEVKPSSMVYGHTDEKTYGGANIPISGIAGDQQAALFGQGCFEKGMLKNTYGTGCFILMNTGDEIIHSKNGLLSTIAWGIDGGITYALEGSVFMGGATVQWLRDEMGLISDSTDTEYFARKVKNTNGLYIVPAFTGLGAPHWDMYARGIAIGISRGTNRNHFIRAALESIAYQSKDVIKAMVEDSNIHLKNLRVDGGACQNDFLMEFQADILGLGVERPKLIETTALGAAYLAGLGVGFWDSKDSISRNIKIQRAFHPKMAQEEREQLYEVWMKAVERAKDWASPL